jgi:hypothetical protein
MENNSGRLAIWLKHQRLGWRNCVLYSLVIASIALTIWVGRGPDAMTVWERLIHLVVGLLFVSGILSIVTVFFFIILLILRITRFALARIVVFSIGAACFFISRVIMIWFGSGA